MCILNIVLLRKYLNQNVSSFLQYRQIGPFNPLKTVRLLAKCECPTILLCKIKNIINNI